MKRQRMIEDKNAFINQAVKYFNYIFGPSLIDGKGEIEIRAYRKRGPVMQEFFDSEVAAAVAAYKLCNRKYDVYFGVNPRMGRSGKKENIHWVSAFHATLDYGIVGHKHLPDYLTYDHGRAPLKDFPLFPSITVHSGGGFHYYWVLKTPINVAEHGVDRIENINQQIVWLLEGETGTEITRLLRVPGTYNFKVPKMPRLVEINYLGKEDDKYEPATIFKEFE